MRQSKDNDVVVVVDDDDDDDDDDGAAGGAGGASAGASAGAGGGSAGAGAGGGRNGGGGGGSGDGDGDDGCCGGRGDGDDTGNRDDEHHEFHADDGDSLILPTPLGSEIQSSWDCLKAKMRLWDTCWAHWFSQWAFFGSCYALVSQSSWDPAAGTQPRWGVHWSTTWPRQSP